MLKDYNHDLIQQLSEISDSSWRMEAYAKTAGECEHCLGLWKKLQADYDEHIKLITEEIKRHVAENRFD